MLYKEIIAVFVRFIRNTKISCMGRT